MNRAVLREARVIWAPQNAPDGVFFAESDEAALFVKERDGSGNLMAVLTNVWQWRGDGTLSRWEYRRWLMGPLAHGRSSAWVQVAFAASLLRT